MLGGLRTDCRLFVIVSCFSLEIWLRETLTLFSISPPEPLFHFATIFVPVLLRILTTGLFPYLFVVMYFTLAINNLPLYVLDYRYWRGMSEVKGGLLLFFIQLLILACILTIANVCVFALTVFLLLCFESSLVYLIRIEITFKRVFWWVFFPLYQCIQCFH